MNAVPGAAAVHRIALGFARQGGETALVRRRFRWPFVLTRPFRLDARPADMLTVILQTSSGALHGGDRLAMEIAAGPGAAAHVTGQGAGIVQPGREAASERLTVVAEAGAFLEVLQEPRILFPGARLSLETELVCAPGGVLFFADAYGCHDPDGEGRRFAGLTSETRLLRAPGGPPVMLERLSATGARLGRFPAQGSVVLAAPFGGDGSLAVAMTPADFALSLTRPLATLPGLYAAASPLPAGAGIGVRLAGEDLRAVRAGIALVWREARHALTGLTPAERRKGS